MKEPQLSGNAAVRGGVEIGPVVQFRAQNMVSSTNNKAFKAETVSCQIGADQ